jgi:amino-acid N-acetyltransferase
VTIETPLDLDVRDTTRTTVTDVLVRPALPDETAALFALVAEGVAEGHVLPRSEGEIALHVPRFVVAASADELLGCAELAPLSPTLAEVRSLVVARSARGHGLGMRLLGAVVDRARDEGCRSLCAFVHQPRAFVRQGFAIVPHQWVPDKIATDCNACVWFRRCRQYAVVLDLRPARRNA